MNWWIVAIAAVVCYLIYRGARRELAKDGEKDLVNVPGWAIFVIVVIMLGAIGGAAASRDDSPSTYSATASRTTEPRTTATTLAPRPTAGLVLVPDSLEVSSTSIGYLELRGKIKNNGSTALKFVKVRGYALDESGATVNTDWGYIDSDILAAGQTSTFKLYVDDPDDEAARGRVVIEEATFAD